jgi:hypothetical protein
MHSDNQQLVSHVRQNSLNVTPVPIHERLPGLAKEIATTIDKSLVRNPKDRFPDAGKLLAAIRK